MILPIKLAKVSIHLYLALAPSRIMFFALDVQRFLRILTPLTLK